MTYVVAAYFQINCVGKVHIGFWGLVRYFFGVSEFRSVSRMITVFNNCFGILWDYWSHCLMMNTAVFLKTAYLSGLLIFEYLLSRIFILFVLCFYGWSVVSNCKLILFLEGSIFLCTLYPSVFGGWILCNLFDCG